jgi:N-carbamoyl-L-amino-acid hydrolase
MNARKTLPVDGVRLWNDLMALAEITDPDRPYTRRSFSPRFLEGRDWLAQRFADAGLAVSIDAAGNLIGRLNGADARARTIMIGSHSDTVPSGGRFDGAAGVIAALEIARSLTQSGQKLRHALEVVDFLAEEPSEYGLSCVGSRAMSGKLNAEMRGYSNSDGERLDAAIERMGGKPAALVKKLRDDVAAFFELHIEQGIVLEKNASDVGIVTGIVGITRVEIIFSGAAAHVGTTPMELRRDALAAAAETAVFVARRASELARGGCGHFVATTGVLDVVPNAANIVPKEARMIVDARAEKRDVMQSFLQALDRESAAVATRYRVERTGYKLLSDTMPVLCDPNLRGLLDESAHSLGLRAMPLASGAGHDAAFMAELAPMAMVFVPCKDGKSHTPEEWAEPDAIAAGAAVMLEAVRRFDDDRC